MHPPSPFALTVEELGCLKRFRGRAPQPDFPSLTRSLLLSRGYLESFKDGVVITPRGRTALLCARS